MISLELARFSYRPGDRPVLAGIGFEVAPGSSLAIVGGSGSGKTTLARILAGHLPGPGHGQMLGTLGLGSEQISFQGLADDPQLDFPAWSSLVGYVSQNPRTQLSTVKSTVAEELAYGLENQGLERRLIRERVAAVAERLGLGPLLDRSPLHLSGGQLQKLVIGSMAVTGPKVLILDEPEAGLDAPSRAALRQLLDELQRNGVALVVCGQSLDGFARQAEDMIVLDEGRCRFRGPWQSVVRAPEVAALPVFGNPYVELARFVEPAEDARALPVDEAETAAYFAPRLRGEPAAYDGGASVGAAAVATPAAASPAAPLAVVEHARFTYGQPAKRRQRWLAPAVGRRRDHGTDPALDDVSLEIRPGERIAVMGPNGAGKTTLLRQLNGLAKPQAGRSVVAGRDTAHHPVGHLAGEVGYLFQNSDNQLFERTVEREVGFGPRNQRLDKAVVAHRVADALYRTGLEAAAGEHPYELAGSDRKRVALASIVAAGPKLWALDEPTTSLDKAGVELLQSLIAEHTSTGGAAVLVTHDMDFAAAVCGRLIVMDRGRIVADGPFGKVVENLFTLEAALEDAAALRSPAGLVPPRIWRLAALLGLELKAITPAGFAAALDRGRAYPLTVP